jgi:hypothetical protein
VTVGDLYASRSRGQGGRRFLRAYFLYACKDRTASDTWSRSWRRWLVVLRSSMLGGGGGHDMHRTLFRPPVCSEKEQSRVYERQRELLETAEDSKVFMKVLGERGDKREGYLYPHDPPLAGHIDSAIML